MHDLRLDFDLRLLEVSVSVNSFSKKTIGNGSCLLANYGFNLNFRVVTNTDLLIFRSILLLYGS